MFFLSQSYLAILMMLALIFLAFWGLKKKRPQLFQRLSFSRIFPWIFISFLLLGLIKLSTDIKGHSEARSMTGQTAEKSISVHRRGLFQWAYIFESDSKIYVLEYNLFKSKPTKLQVFPSFKPERDAPLEIQKSATMNELVAWHNKTKGFTAWAQNQELALLDLRKSPDDSGYKYFLKMK